MKVKKILVSIAALSTALSIPYTSVSAENNLSDLTHLQSALLGNSDIISSDDINNNGDVNVFDSCKLKNILLQDIDTGVEKESSIPMTAENVKIIGRTLYSDDTTWLTMSGSAVEFNVTGSSAEVVIKGNYGIDADPDYRPRYAVYVNDVLLVDKTLDSTEEKVSLLDEVDSSNAKVKVIMLSEAMYGTIGVNKVNVVSSSAKPVKPTAEQDLCIEFIGDSITCAYGVEGASNYESFKTTTENFTKSYAYLTAEKLGADYSAVCYSGHGVISGYTADGNKNTDSLIPDYYGYTSKIDGYKEPWDFETRKNDVVVINLGTNDSGYVNADVETRSQEFIDGYVDFLSTIREKNPDAYIICTLGTMGCEDIYVFVEDAVEKYKADSGDERVMSYLSTVQKQADGYGSDWHPSAVTQQNSAYVLADKICQALGMESDQIGLDVAENAVYDVAMKDGANCAHFVGYDKSFWINMVTGGTSAESIEALISGIGLKAGGEYRLEFDCTSGIETEIPVLLRGNSVYHSDTINSSSEVSHYSETFTVSENDENAEIVFQVGGKDSYNVTLSNVKLVKIG